MKEEKRQQRTGMYLDLTHGEFFHREELLLRGLEGKVKKVPTALVLVAAPLFGLAYVVFLPVAGIAALFYFAGYKMKQVFTARHQEDAPTA